MAARKNDVIAEGNEKVEDQPDVREGTNWSMIPPVGTPHEPRADQEFSKLPLDEDGVPARDPVTGHPLKLDDEGKPIEPDAPAENHG